MLNIASRDSLVDKLTSTSYLNGWFVLGDKVCKSSTSSNRINLSNSLNSNVCITFFWYDEIIIIIIIIIIVIIIVIIIINEREEI